MLEVAAWCVKPVKDNFASRHVHPKYLIRLVFLYLESIQCSAVGREHRISNCLRSRGVRSQGLLPNSRSSGSCSSPCIPGVGCCSRIPLALREVLPGRHGGRLLSPRMWREIGAVAASCHLQFHMSEFSLTFSNNTKNMWLTSETTHLFLAAKTRLRVTYCKALFPPDSDPYWSLLKSCVQFFHNCPHSNHGRQPIKH